MHGWEENSKYILIELKSLRDDHHELHDEMVNIRIEIARLKLKASFWGAVAGTVPVIALVLLKLFTE